MEKRFKKGDEVVFANLENLCVSTEGKPVYIHMQEREVRGSGAEKVVIYGAAHTTETLSFSTGFFPTSNFDPGKVSATEAEALHKLDESLVESERRLLVMLERVRQGRAQIAEKLMTYGGGNEAVDRRAD